MLIRMVTPAPAGSKSGNRVSALRWAHFLRELGHRVIVQTDYSGERADVLFALHAKKSAAAVRRFAECHDASIVVALTGTDLYRDLERSPRARETLQRATRIVALQPMAMKRLSPPLRDKTRVILQSAEPLAPVSRNPHTFDVCVVGHLRSVKDPLRAALAVRRLEPESRIRVLQAGAALSPALATRAMREMRRNARYRWLGELSRHRSRRLIARSRLLVLSSRMEGGANVVSEAIVLGTPILASRIEGTIGQLGADYPGYFEVGDTRGLAELLARAERDPRFLQTLTRWCTRLAPRFSPDRERAALAALMRELAAGRAAAHGAGRRRR